MKSGALLSSLMRVLKMGYLHWRWYLILILILELVLAGHVFTLQSQLFSLGSLLSGASVRSSFDMHKNVRQFVLAVIKWSCDFIAYLIACKSPQMHLHMKMLNSNAFTVANACLKQSSYIFPSFSISFCFCTFFYSHCVFHLNRSKHSESYQFSHQIRRNPFEVTQTPFLTQSDPIDSKVISLIHSQNNKICRVHFPLSLNSIAWIGDVDTHITHMMCCHNFAMEFHQVLVPVGWQKNFLSTYS